MPSGALRYLGETIDWRSNLAKRSIPLLMRRLRQAGFGSEFVSAAILPDWWDQSCVNQPELLPEIEIRVGRFLAVPLSTVSDPESTLEPLGYPGARLRCVRDIGHDRLAPAIHAAMRIAGAVVRNLKEPVPARTPPPSDGLAWRQEIRGLDGSLVLDAIVEDLWTRGIPVVPAHLLPTPGFQGLAAVVEDRPVVVLGHRHDEPGRVAFRIAHEAGHIAKGDCTPDAPVVDEDEEILSGRRNGGTRRPSMRSELSLAKPRFLCRAPALLATSGTWPLRPQRRRGKQASTRDRSSSHGCVRRATTRLPPGPRKPCTSQPEPPESYGSTSRGS